MDAPRTNLERIVAAQGRQLRWIAASVTPGVDVSTVSRWCSGERVIPPARIKQLAVLLNVSEREIVAQPEAVTGGVS